MRENFVPFELERIMSIWEYQVEYNLSESGVHPMTTDELLQGNPDLIQKLAQVELNYPQTNGSVELRENIAALYPGATRDHIVATTGAAQANFTSILTALDPGDQIAVLLPNYMQIWGVAKNLQLDVRTFSLKEELGWGLDIDELNRTVTDKTRLIAVCNPNNPTGHIMSTEEMNAVIAAADKVGAWLLADEVYAGAEHNTDSVTPSFYGRYDKVLAMGSLSKAYGLPGLRIGWVHTTQDMAEEIWATQDYVTICTTMLGNWLGAYALSPEVRPRILDRTRNHVRHGYNNFNKWCEENADLVSFIPPQAAAIGFVRYKQQFNSTQFVERLIQEKKVYVVPGDHFGLDHHLRISYDLSDTYVNEGLKRLKDLLLSVE